MYNPSRGGVRGGADQFTWESVKNDKHRENYLGHSVMAPVGRWQKGKDLSWYAKGRNESSSSDKADRSELASIKRAEEEAMLIALGHNIVKKTQTLSKEDIRDALKRNTGDRDELNTERVDGVGASSQRVASLSGINKNSKQTAEGVAFECRRERNSEAAFENEKRDHSISDDRKKSKKKSKKHKKEKKHKKHHKESYQSDSSHDAAKHRMKHEKNGSDSDSRISSKQKSHKMSKQKYRDYSPDRSDEKSNQMSKHKHRDYSPDRSDEKSHSDLRRKNHKRNKKQSACDKRRRHDTSESD